MPATEPPDKDTRPPATTPKGYVMNLESPPSTQGAGSLIVESGIVESHAGPDGGDVRMVGHVHPWGWT